MQAALDSLREERTTIVVAHRLSTVMDADCIVVLHVRSPPLSALPLCTPIFWQRCFGLTP